MNASKKLVNILTGLRKIIPSLILKLHLYFISKISFIIEGMSYVIIAHL